MEWLFGTMIVIMVAVVFWALVLNRICKNQRSQLLRDVADTGTLQDVKNLAEKLEIVLVHDIGFRQREWRPGWEGLSKLVWPGDLGKFTRSLLKAKEDDPEFAKYIQGIAVWLLEYYSRNQRRLFLNAMVRHPKILDEISVALQAERSGRKTSRETMAAKRREEKKQERQLRAEGKKRERQLQAWGVKLDTTPQKDS